MVEFHPALREVTCVHQYREGAFVPDQPRSCQSSVVYLVSGHVPQHDLAQLTLSAVQPNRQKTKPELFIVSLFYDAPTGEQSCTGSVLHFCNGLTPCFCFLPFFSCSFFFFFARTLWVSHALIEAHVRATRFLGTHQPL